MGRPGPGSTRDARRVPRAVKVHGRFHPTGRTTRFVRACPLRQLARLADHRGMSDDASLLIDALDSLDIQDRSAVRAFAQRVDALADAEAIESVCSRSRAVRAALGVLRAE